MNNKAIVNRVVVQLVHDGLVVVNSDGKLSKHSAKSLGAAATSLAYVMDKDRKDMFRYIRALSLQSLSPTLQEKEYDEITSDDAN